MHHEQAKLSAQLPPHSENVEEEQHRVEMALQAVYSSHSAAANAPNSTGNDEWHQQRQLADRYLTSFQSRRVAWMVADRLLASPSMEHRFFAATTLHRKCRQDVQQLPSESLPSLRDSLLHHLRQNATDTANSALLTRLALCVSALAIQMRWTSVVMDLVEGKVSNAQPNDPQWMLAILTVLQVLPEEAGSPRVLLVDESFRFTMRNHLISVAPRVLQHQDSRLWLAWIRHVPMPPQTVVQAGLVPHCVAQLPTEAAVDVLVDIVRLYPSHVDGNEQLVDLMWTTVLGLRLDHVLSGGGGGGNDTNDDAKLAFTRLYTEMGEAYLSKLLFLGPTTTSTTNDSQNDPLSALTFVQNVLRCSTIDDLDIASMTFQFWYRFVAKLESMDDLRQRQDLVDRGFGQVLLDLLDVCLKHLEYPDDGGEDDEDDFHQERYYLSETVEDCCRLLGCHAVLHRVGGRYIQVMQQEQQSTAQTSWTKLEAILYALQPLARYVPADEHEILPPIFMSLLQLPRNIEPLRYTISLFIGKYAVWLSTHTDLLQSLLPYLAEGLSVTRCCKAAALAIKDLCQSIPLGESVLQLYHQIWGKLELRDELQVLEGLCRGTPPDQSQLYLQQLLQPIGDRFQTYFSGTTPSTTAKSVLAEIDRITTIVRYLPTSPAAIAHVMQSVWPLLEQASQLYASDLEVAEKVCRLHKHALRKAGSDAYAPILPRLCQFVVAAFESSRQSPYLYLASIVVTEYPQYPQLLDMLSALSATCFGFLTNLETMIQNPDVVEELFYCFGRVLKYRPALLLVPTSNPDTTQPGPPHNATPSSLPLTNSLIQCALVGMELYHHNANRASLHLLERVWGCRSVPSSSIQALLQQHGAAVVSRALEACMGGSLPAYYVDSGNGNLAAILFAIMEVTSPQVFSEWMAAGLVRAPAKPQRDLMAVVQQQQQQPLPQHVFFDAVVGFHLDCDRYRQMGGADGGTE